MKKLTLLLFSQIIMVMLTAQTSGYGLNCSTIIIGKDASATGFVTVAHNEDDGGNQIVNFYKIAGKDNEKGETMRLKDGAVIPKSSHSYSCLWLEMPGQDFADTYMNENGVLVTSNSCQSRELFGEITDGGIGYELRRIIAERALSARTGVEMAGQLVDKWGYSASGRTYTIADKNEAWIFAVVRGKQWVAQRVPDDQVAFIPNYYTIKEINLNDSENFLASKDLINYAVRRGWYDQQKDGNFNFTKVYSSERNLSSMANIGRMWIGVSMLSGKEYKPEDDFPFSFVAQKKISMKEIIPVLTNHYEGTHLDDSKDYKNGSPHSNKTMSICASTQQLSFIAELRSGLPWDIGGRIWIAPRRGCVNPYIPVYFGVTEFGSDLAMDSHEKAYELHFNRDETIYDRSKPMLWWNFVAVAEAADKDYSGTVGQRRKTKEDLEKQYIKLTAQLEKDYLPVYKKEPARALSMLNNFQKEAFSMAVAENNKFLGK
jgi:dipeptidase